MHNRSSKLCTALGTRSEAPDESELLLGAGRTASHDDALFASYLRKQRELIERESAGMNRGLAAAQARGNSAAAEAQCAKLRGHLRWLSVLDAHLQASTHMS